MAKKAFIVGVSTEGLHYCERDAFSMKECLSRYGYDIIEPKKFDRREILEEFDNMMKNCVKTDTVVIYFSGHATPPQGDLEFFLKDNDKINLNDEIAKKLNNKCKASKLVILDCCNAGAITKGWDFTPREPYIILTASHFLDEAREIDEWKAGFFTHKIHEGLTYRFSEISDNEDNLGVEKLYNWLLEETRTYNKNNPPTTVPEPRWFGDQTIRFSFGTVPETLKLRKRINELELENSSLREEIKKVKSIKELPNVQEILDILSSFPKEQIIEFIDNYKIRMEAYEILSDQILQKQLIEESIANEIFSDEYSYLSDEDKMLLRNHLFACINWLMDSLADPIGAVAGVNSLRLDNFLLHEPRFLVLGHVKTHMIPEKISNSMIINKLQDYLDILIDKLRLSNF